MPDLVRISCPDCHGVLETQVRGPKRLLVFVCRVQHTFSVMDLLAGKEEDVETRLWTTLNVAEELAELVTHMADLAADQDLDGAAAGLRARATGARRLAAQLREAIEHNRVVSIHDDVARIQAPVSERTATA